MSYASRLVAMSRGGVPRAAAPVLGAASPREEHVEVELGAPPARTAASEPVRPAAVPAHTTIEPTPHVPRFAAPAVPAPHVHHQTQIERETLERHTIVEHTTAPATPAPRALPLPAQPVERIAMPPQATWLAEDRSAADPLVATADTDELRELMRTVRAWTASPPTQLPAARSVQPDAPAMIVQAAPEPTHVSIGNVVITVEDAPAPTSRKRAEMPHAPSDRMSRNHIRGG